MDVWYCVQEMDQTAETNSELIGFYVKKLQEFIEEFYRYLNKYKEPGKRLIIKF